MNKLFLISIVLLLTACQQSNVTKTELVSEASTKAETTVTEPAVESIVEQNVDPVTVKTGQSELRFTHKTSSERAQIGVPFDIDINFENATDTAFTADFSTSPGLSMNTANRIEVLSQKRGIQSAKRVTVTPQAEGIYYLNFYKVGAEQQKPSVIRVIAGDKDIKEYLQTPGDIVEQEDGTKVITMKADEG